jgi:hypothetical protein
MGKATIVCKGLVGKAGAIYDGHISDYDDSRIVARGVKVLDGLDEEQRERLVRNAEALQRQGVRYDFPGLIRGYVRLLTGIIVPGTPRLLFCSAFVQKVYRDTFGDRGRFVPTLSSHDVTPDEIWYSPTGRKFTEDITAGY